MVEQVYVNHFPCEVTAMIEFLLMLTGLLSQPTKAMAVSETQSKQRFETIS